MHRNPCTQGVALIISKQHLGMLKNFVSTELKLELSFLRIRSILPFLFPHKKRNTNVTQITKADQIVLFDQKGT